MAAPLVAPLSDARDPLLVGGKAHGLHRALAFGLPVPRTVVVTTAAWHLFIASADDSPALAILRDPGAACGVGALAEAARDLGETLQCHGLPAAPRSAITQAYARELGGGPVAVRSSGVAEDASSYSFAGQFYSVLNVVTAADVADAVLGVWLSGVGGPVVEYQIRTGQGQLPMPMGVLVQEMVRAECSGVLFSKNPVSGDPGEILISSNFGLGTTVADGSVVPDTFVLDHGSGTVITRDIRPKTEREDGAPAGGVRRAPVEVPMQCEPSLGPRTLQQLWELAIRAEELFGMPIDAEWALAAGGRLSLLQVRPITG